MTTGVLSLASGSLASGGQSKAWEFNLYTESSADCYVEIFTSLTITRNSCIVVSEAVSSLALVSGVSIPTSRVASSTYVENWTAPTVDLAQYSPTDYTGLNVSEFSVERGLDISRKTIDMTYLYGLSDFWSVIFSDQDTLNTVLGVGLLNHSEVYSRFLQLASQLSLESIQTYIGCQIKPLYLTSDSLVSGTTYHLPEKILSARYLSNRPFLPTKTYQNDVHYSVDTTSNTITFHTSIENLGLLSRTSSVGVTTYSLWASDVRVDEDLVYNVYGKLIGAPDSVENLKYKDFVASMFYLYENGPTIGAMVKGLNIALGIPLARDYEKVVEVRRYLNTDNWLVITNSNSYIIPYGLKPTVSVGQQLNTFDALANWVEVKDYNSDGEWWINMYIPSVAIPFVDTEFDRYAYIGSNTELLMRKYLKTNTFLVNVKTTYFKDIQPFSELSKLINQVKPSHSIPIYLWTIPTEDESITLTDVFNYSKMNLTFAPNDGVIEEHHSLRRDSSSPLTRETPKFTRFCGPSYINRLVGNDAFYNGPPRSF